MKIYERTVNTFEEWQILHEADFDGVRTDIDWAVTQQNLIYCPKYALGDFRLHGKLLSMHGSPMLVSGDIKINYLGLRSLSGSPIIAMGSFFADNNSLNALEGCPRIIRGYFNVSHNHLESLVGMPTEIHGSAFIRYNNLKSLDGMAKVIRGELLLDENHQIEDWEGLLNIDECEGILVDDVHRVPREIRVILSLKNILIYDNR